MPPYIVKPIDPRSPSDTRGVARANMSSFYQNPHWALLWGSMPLEEIIDGNTNRLPWDLVRNQKFKRHQMAVDSETGEVVGYARWVFLNGAEKKISWDEARIGEATEEEKVVYERSWMAYTDENGSSKGLRTDIARAMGSELHAATMSVVGDRPFLGRFI